jgi:hypothetical protein
VVAGVALAVVCAVVDGVAADEAGLPSRPESPLEGAACPAAGAAAAGVGAKAAANWSAVSGTTGAAAGDAAAAMGAVAEPWSAEVASGDGAGAGAATGTRAASAAAASAAADAPFASLWPLCDEDFWELPESVESGVVSADEDVDADWSLDLPALLFGCV